VATGKSAVAAMLKKYFKYVIDADEVARRIVEKGKPAYKKIIKAFGPSLLAKDGSLDRKKLAGSVFKNKKKKKLLEKITHPLIISIMKNTIAGLKRKNKIIIFEAPLLFEAKMEKMADIILVVASSQKKQIERFTEKGYSKKDALLRIKAQLPLEQKIKKADIVIYNNGSLQELKKNVKNLVALLRELP